MRLYARRGERDRARRQYGLLCAALRRELDAEPSPETSVFYKSLVMASNEALTPATSIPLSQEDGSAGPAQHNVPLSLTSFVGRKREIAEVTRLLDESRLLTLTGPGSDPSNGRRAESDQCCSSEAAI